MVSFLILTALVIFLSIALSNASSKIGMPALFAFILLGMVFGNGGLIPLDIQNPEFIEEICTVALIFIMFYGGFGTRWSAAKPVAAESIVMASLGVILTAGLTGVFCHYVLKWGWSEALLLGSVISSTDAASVFSILKSHKLNLRNNTAQLLEVESGSNDPCSYMLTVIMLSVIGGTASVGNIVLMFFKQVAFGLAFGFLFARLAVLAMNRIKFRNSGFDSLFLFATALISYAVPAILGGNGYLSVYIVGIILGNADFSNKKNMVHFFDGITGLMQVTIFFMLGLMAKPSGLLRCILPAVAIFLGLLVVVRPLVSAVLLTPARYRLKQQMLISICGLRGASSIVFAIVATAGNDVLLTNDIFNIVFCVVLLSIGLQGTLIPFASRKLDMIDPDSDIMKTFSDFSDEVNLQFSELDVNLANPWCGKKILELNLPKDMLICSIIKSGGNKIIPNGHSVIEEGDKVVICSKSFSGAEKIRIIQHTVSKNSKWSGKSVRELPFSKSQIILIMRGDKSIIPHGNTQIYSGDSLYINSE